MVPGGVPEHLRTTDAGRRRGEPAVGVDDGHQPVYVDSPPAFRSGWFGGGGGLFGGLLLGSMLGGLGGGWVVEQHVDDVDEADPDDTES
jgi:hypothetical protein